MKKNILPKLGFCDLDSGRVVSSGMAANEFLNPASDSGPRTSDLRASGVGGIGRYAATPSHWSSLHVI